MALVTRYDLLSQQNLEPLSYLFLFRIYTPIALLLCYDNIKDWSIVLRLSKYLEFEAIQGGGLDSSDAFNLHKEI